MTDLANTVAGRQEPGAPRSLHCCYAWPETHVAKTQESGGRKALWARAHGKFLTKF